MGTLVRPTATQQVPFAMASSEASTSTTNPALLVARAAKEAFDTAQLLENGSEERVRALRLVREALQNAKKEILEANQLDMDAARKQVEAGAMSNSLLKRLDLQSSPTKFDDMLQGVEDVANLPDPAGQTTYASKLDEGLTLHRVTCPIGVLLVIFEARPEVIVNITSLAIKSGNAAILKGGKESLHTQAIMTTVIQDALSRTSIPSAYIQTVATRNEISSLLEQDKYIDLVIPRGSNALVSNIQHSTRIPVMGHADGICCIYLDEAMDVRKACKVVVDSKTSYPAACNAVETLVVHESLLKTHWPTVADALLKAGVTLHCDPPSLSALSSAEQSTSGAKLVPAKPEDYDTEFLSHDLAVITVPSLLAAISHINEHSSKHTNAIVTEKASTTGKQFCRAIDAAGTYINASTRFADGFRYGFGTEVGIATGKTHARGPVGLEGLMIYKYVMQSEGEEGHVSLEFGGEQGKKFLHEKLPLDVTIL